jgi:hypothetical protein
VGVVLVSSCGDMKNEPLVVNMASNQADGIMMMRLFNCSKAEFTLLQSTYSSFAVEFLVLMLIH